jgi:carboxyl-terminal processing protease
MNALKGKLSVFLLLTALVLGNSSCKEEEVNSTTSGEESEVNAWIRSTMLEHYLWYTDMPAKSKLNFDNDPETFFISLLSDNDGKDYGDGGHYYYSYIEDLSADETSAAISTRSVSQTDYSYGFDFLLYALNDTAYVARVLYVAYDTPASEAGLERGDWIVTMDGEPITASNYSTLYGGSAMQIHLASYDSLLESLAYSKYLQMGSAREIEDDPVYYYNTYTVNNKKVGYLVYNHFTDSKADDDDKYNDELLTLSNEFKTEGVTEFILDLRYNNGGLISCARLLSSILVPESAFGNTFCTLVYNDKQNPQSEKLTFASSTISSGANLNLSTVYVLVSDKTASASELVINALRPYATVVIIGAQTEGKNVGSVSYTNDDYTWKLQPIICKLYNANDESDYVNGFTPTYECDESASIEQFKPFGDTDELLLNTALGLISDSVSIATNVTTRSKLSLKKVANSLDRKASNGVIIR